MLNVCLILRLTLLCTYQPLVSSFYLPLSNRTNNQVFVGDLLAKRSKATAFILQYHLQINKSNISFLKTQIFKVLLGFYFMALTLAFRQQSVGEANRCGPSQSYENIIHFIGVVTRSAFIHPPCFACLLKYPNII